MPYYYVDGGNRLKGTLQLQGAKNSALPLLAASMLAEDGKVTLDNVPKLQDVEVCLLILRQLGCQIEQNNGSVAVKATSLDFAPLSQSVCEKMRSSVLFLSPLICRFKKATLYLPGGCLLGERPIDLHIKSLEKMGVDCRCDGHLLQAECPKGLRGAVISLPYPSVGATENILMAASLAKGKTVIYGAAGEPEIGELIRLLRAMGAKISVYRNRIEIIGVKALHGCTKAVMPDRIAAFTYMAAALATDGEITIQNCPMQQMPGALEFIQKIGGVLIQQGENVTVRRAGACLLPVEKIQSGPYPEFPTDDGAAALVLLSLAIGQSNFRETVFSGRFAIVEQLKKFGADITANGDTATVRGVDVLHGAAASATDLRAGAALLIAALCADGHSRINGGEHILRGYQDITGTLRLLGAKITERS